MTEWFQYAFGTNRELSPLHMSVRAVAVFLICLALIRFSGRRSFAMGTPVDNVLAILLGAILSRAVVGASPFLSTVAAAVTLAALHRFMAWLGLYSHRMGRLFKGEAKIIYDNGKFNKENMRYCRITRRDLMAGIRLSANTDSFSSIRRIYVERNGRISVILKDNDDEKTDRRDRGGAVRSA
jgi:uncharacterized membrane protein YcaP (DUF421 family)